MEKLWVWICVVFMCRWGLFKMYLEKHILGVEKITLGLFRQKATLWAWGASFGIFTFTFSAALCQVNAPWMHLTACCFHPSCPQGLYTLWLVFVSPCQAAELRVSLTAPTGQHRAGPKVFSVCVTLGGRNWGMPTLPCVSNTSVSKPECSLHWGWCEIFSFSEGRCLRGSPGLMEKAVFLVFCHAEGGSAIYDWFNVFIYTIQLQNVLELMQGITKQLEKTVPPVCEGQHVQSVRESRSWCSRASLWYRSCVGNNFPGCSEPRPSGFIPKWLPSLLIAVVLLSLDTELEWPGNAVTSCPDRLWQWLALSKSCSTFWYFFWLFFF